MSGEQNDSSLLTIVILFFYKNWIFLFRFLSLSSRRKIEKNAQKKQKKELFVNNLDMSLVLGIQTDLLLGQIAT